MIERLNDYFAQMCTPSWWDSDVWNM